MILIQLIFYVFSAIALFSGLMVVVSPNPVRGALFLVLTFFAMSGIWMLLHAEFLALILVLVYVGAVMTLFLFVVMMLRVNILSLREGFVRYFPVVTLMVLLIIGLTILVLGPKRFGLALMPAPLLEPANYSNISELGMLLYTEYAYPFEIAAIILLTAIIAAICLTHRPPKNRKVQNVNAQLQVQARNRIRILNMPSEKKQTSSGAGT